MRPLAAVCALGTLLALSLPVAAQIQNADNYPSLITALDVARPNQNVTNFVFGELIDGRVCFFEPQANVLTPVVCTDCNRVSIFTAANMTTASSYDEASNCLGPAETNRVADCTGQANTINRLNHCGVCEPFTVQSCQLTITNQPGISVTALTTAGTRLIPRPFNPSDFNTFKVDINVTLGTASSIRYRILPISDNSLSSPRNAFSANTPTARNEFIAGNPFSISPNQIVRVYATSGRTNAPFSFVIAAFFKADPNVAALPFEVPRDVVIGASIGAAAVIGIAVGLFFYFRIKKRKEAMELNLDLAEKSAKQNQYRAVFDYKPQNADELELKVGDIVQITKKNPDGWWEGVSYRLKRKKGMFPSNYVEEVTGERLMWVERPQTVFGRMSQRLSMAFGLGGPVPSTPAMPPKSTTASTQNLIPPTPNQRGGAPQVPHGAAPPPPMNNAGSRRAPAPPNGNAPPNPGYGAAGYNAAPQGYNNGYGAPQGYNNGGGNYI